jgi:hypothetical protein
MTMVCPECGSRDLRVSADITCVIVEKEVGGKVMDVIEPIDDPELYWDRDSWTVCQAEDCGHSGEAKFFEPEVCKAEDEKLGDQHD